MQCVLRLLGLVTVVSVIAGIGGQERIVRYEHFDDYLISALGRQRQQNQVLKQENPQPQDEDSQVEQTASNSTSNSTLSPSNTTEVSPTENPLTSEDILGYFKDVPREHWSCCMLGKLAGDKGFHCHASFYAARISRRNGNRAHNRKMLFHGTSPIATWGRMIMRTFQRCVLRHSADFHKCCYAATVERSERTRWVRYRDHASHIARRMAGFPH